MINPVLTILFDLFLIGSALTVAAGMVSEYFLSREAQVGASRRRRDVRSASGRRGATVHRFPERRRAA